MQNMEGAALFAVALLSNLLNRKTASHNGAPESMHTELAEPAEECAEVRAVLSFWFDGDTTKNYKYKWFPSSNKDIQENADRAVSEGFGECLALAVSDKLGHWGSSTKAIIAKIIVLGKWQLIAGEYLIQ